MSNLSARSLRSQLGLNSILTVILGLAVVVMVNYVGFRYYKRHDFSKGSYYDLSEKTVQLLKKLPDQVEVTTVMSNSQLRQQIEDLLQEYRTRSGGKVKLDFIDAAVDLSRAEDEIKKYNLDPKQENVVIFEYKDRHKVLSDTELADYGPGNPYTGQQGELKDFKGEQQFTTAIQSLVEGKTAKVYFLTGHGERDLTDTTSPGGIGNMNIYVQRDNIATFPLNLMQSGGAVPADADALVVAGPRSALAPSEVQAISNYLANKGKMILLEDPQVVSGLEPIVQHYGIQLQDDRVTGLARMAGVTYIIRTAIGTDYADHPAVRAIKGLNLKMDNARSLALVKDPANPNLSKVVALVKAPVAFWGETNFDDPKPQYDPGTDVAGPLTLAMAYDGGQIPGDGVKLVDTRLVVAGSSLFLANEKIDSTGLDFFLNSLNWELQKDLALGISPKVAQEFGLNVSPLQRSTIVFLAFVLAPGLAALAGLVVWFSRRR